MIKEDGKIDIHVFVCTNKKEGKECCADKGAEEFRKNLKEKCRLNPELSGKVRINSAGCLDRCKEGIAIAIYPQKNWLLQCKPQDIDSIYDEVVRLARR